MPFKTSPYSPEKHADLIASWMDEEAIYQTGIENWDDDVQYWQKESPETFHAVIISISEPVAAVYYFAEPENMHIGAVILAPAKRGQGIGTAILKYLLFIHTPSEKATAVIFPNNVFSKKAFYKAGFVNTSTHPDGDAEYYAFNKPKVTIAGQGQLPSWMYGTEMPYRFVVIFARYRNKWLYARHKERRTWETAGGHIEPGETPEEAARRELWEETGAVDFNIRYVFDYHVDNTDAKPGDHAAGQVFIADIETLGSIPESEMAEVSLWDSYPSVEQLTYPAILPELYEKIKDL